MSKHELTTSEKRAQHRKDLIKNILIVFLVVMLLLTFFSGTIQNWSLPEVATSRIEAKSISPQIRGNGTVEADDPYNVVLKQSRKIASVAVKAGDEVKKDDPIYYLEDLESQELEDAKKELRKLETEYELALFTEGASDAAIARARSGNTDSIDGYQMQLKNMNDRLLAATEADKAVQSRIDSLEAEHKEILSAIGVPDTSEQQYANASAEAELTKLAQEKNLWTAELEAQKAIMEANMISVQVAEEAGQGVTAGEQQQQQQQQQQPETETAAVTVSMTVPDEAANPVEYAAYTAAKQAVERAEAALAGIEVSTALLQIQIADNTRDSSHLTTRKEQELAQENQRYETQLAALNEEKLQTAAALAEVTKEHEQFLGNVKAEISLTAMQQDIADVRNKVEKLRETSIGSVVTAPVDGIVSSLTYVAGQTIVADETAAVIQVAGKAMTMSFSVSNDQAKQLKPGDQAEPQNSWQYSQFKATLKAIKPDNKDPGNKKTLIFAIDSPEVQAGQSVSIKLGQSTRTYEMTVPNSAIREDNNGKFILIIEEKASPLRNRYIARRADVEITAQDDTTTAINAPLEGWEYVITTSTVPIRSGEEVRLASSSY